MYTLPRILRMRMLSTPFIGLVWILGYALAAPIPASAQEAPLVVTTSNLASVVLPGVSSGTTVASYLRFSNGDSTAQIATVHLRDPDSGLILFAWTTPSIPPGGTLETAVVDMIARGTPGVLTGAIPPTLVAEVVGAFVGRVQHVTLAANTGALSHVSTCGMVLIADPMSLPYVSGPGRQDVSGLLRVMNGTASYVSVRLTFRDNTGQSSVWSSPGISPMGSYVRAVKDIALAATPPISGQANSLSVVADPAPLGIALSYSEGLVGTAGFDDFSAACMLTPAVSAPNANATPGTGTTQAPPKLPGDSATCPAAAHAMPLGDGTTFCMF